MVPAVVLGASAALLLPAAANAATVVSQATAQIIVAPTGMATDPSVSGAITQSDGSTNSFQNVPIDAAGISDVTNGYNGVFNSAFFGVQPLGNNGQIQLAGMGQAAQSNTDGSSVGYAGSVSAAPSSLVTSAGSTGLWTTSLGTPNAGDAATVTLAWPGAVLNNNYVNVVGDFTTLGATATDPAGGSPSGSLSLAGSLTVSGADLAGLYNNVTNKPGICVLNCTINTTSLQYEINTIIDQYNSAYPGSTIAYPFVTSSGGSASMTLSMGDLLAAAGVSNVNALPAGANLLTYVPQAVQTKVRTTLNGILTQIQSAAASNSNLMTNVTTTQQQINSDLTTFNNSITNTSKPGNNGLFTPDLNYLGSIQVGLQSNNADGSFTETALSVTNQNAKGNAYTLNIANASVGPNAGISSVPILSSGTAGLIVAGAVALFAITVTSAIAIRRRRATAGAHSEGVL